MGAKKDYVALSLNENVLKISQIKIVGNNLKVMNISVQDLSGIEPDDLPKTIQSSVSKFNVKSSQVVYIVPHGITTTKNIEIPSINPEEIKSIVNLQAGRHTPFSREEIQIGYVNIGVYKSNYTKVLLVITNKSTLKNQLSILEKAGLKIKKVLFAPEGIAGFYSNLLNMSTDEGPVGIIDVGNKSTDFVVVLKGMAITSRSIPVGKANLISEGPAAKDKLIDELKKTIEDYQREDIDQTPQNYIITSCLFSAYLSFIFLKKLSLKEIFNPNMQTTRTKAVNPKKAATNISRL